jgi:hypothetical protein
MCSIASLTSRCFQARGDAVHLLGHQPPDGGAGGGAAWRDGMWPRFSALVSKHRDTVKGSFFGHVHVDQWTLTRECAAAAPGAPYVETSGIKWCSGGGDYAPGDAYGAGVDGLCPIVPAAWTDERGVAACEATCSSASGCVGFTLYFADATKVKARECCFRTGSTASKPPDPTSTARCYEKAPPLVCDGPATSVLLPGPSLTEGWPATNPALRLLEFNAAFELAAVRTYYADLHEATAAGAPPAWRLEYDFAQQYGMADLTPASFEQLAARLAQNGSAAWADYRGKAGGLYCTKYDEAGAPFAPIYPCKACGGACKAGWIRYLNATNVLA